MDWIQILQGAFIAAISAWLYYKDHKERKERRILGLEENPKSCKDHEDRLRAIERDIGDIKGSVRAIRVKLGMPEE